MQASHSLLDCALLLAFAILIGIVATAGRITKDQIQYTQVLFTWDCHRNKSEGQTVGKQRVYVVLDLHSNTNDSITTFW